MEVSIILLSLLVAFGNSILLKGPSRPAVPVAGNMQKFLDLLLDEKHSRLLLEQEFNNLKAGFEAQNITLTQQIISKEKDIEQISLTLDTEMSNRRQLESAYTRLSEEFRNLTMEHSEEMRRNTDLKANLRNLSIALNFLRQENADLKRKQGYRSGFSARKLTGGMTAGSLTFAGVISNIGNHFNAATGRYTCVYPGEYFFDLTLYQTTNRATNYCFIRKNGKDTMYVAAVSDPRFPGSYHSASNSVVLQLKIGT